MPGLQRREGVEGRFGVPLASQSDGWACECGGGGLETRRDSSLDCGDLDGAAAGGGRRASETSEDRPITSAARCGESSQGRLHDYCDAAVEG